jgi:hypothetical protein
MKCFLVIVGIILEVLFTSFAAPNSSPRIYRDKIDPHWFAVAGGETNRFWYRIQLLPVKRNSSWLTPPRARASPRSMKSESPKP